MKWTRSGRVIICALFLAGPVSGTEWPTYLRDATRVGCTPDSLSTPLGLHWVYSSTGPPQMAFPGPGGRVIEGLKLRHRVRFDDVFHVAIVGSCAYFGSSVDHTVRCVDLQTGAPQWTFITDGPVRLAPTVVEGRLYIGSDDGFVYCLRADSGALIWKLRAGPRDERVLARGRMTSRWPVRTGVLVEGGAAYFGAGVFPHDTVYLCAVRADSGEIIWKNDRISQRGADRDDLTPQGYLLANERLLFVPSGRTLPAAFDRATGEPVHKQQGGGKQVGGAAALLAGDQVYSLGGEEFILALNQQTGAIENRWQAHQMTLRGDIAFLADGQEIVAIDRLRYAESRGRRLELEREKFEVQRKLRVNPAALQLERVGVARTRLADVQQQLERLATDEPQGLPEKSVLEAEVARHQATLDASIALYEKSRRDYEQFSARLKLLQEQLKDTTEGGVTWRRNIPHESVMIVAGNSLVVGGQNEFVLLDCETGKTLWTQIVDGEVRGLAAADGYLLVSTTAGKIYGFGDATTKSVDRPQQHPAAPQDFWAQDEQSDLYAAAAQEILQRASVTRGFALVYGSEQGRLAHELVNQSDLIVYCLDSDAQKVRDSRQRLLAAGLYGSRIIVDHCDLANDPYPNYFANLIVSDKLLRTGQMPGDPKEITRHLKPEGGVLCLGVPSGAADPLTEQASASVAAWLPQTQLDGQSKVETFDGWTRVTRGPLPGVGYWTHQYGNAGNTACVDDQRIKGGVRILWYGDPGPSQMVNRHFGATAPLSAHGRLFVQGEESLMAYDAYNGQFLWELDNPGAIRTGVYNNFEPGNLVVGDNCLFMVVQEECLQLDAATGQELRRFTMPDPDEDGGRQWGYVAYRSGRLYGTRTTRKMIAEEARRRGRPAETDSSDIVFAIDVATGQKLWSHQAQSISHTTVAIDEQRVYFINSSITSEQRERLLQQDKSQLVGLTGKERELAENRMKRIDARQAVALDAATGQVVWSEPVDVTDCTGVGIGAGRLTLMAAQDYVVLCGANANGHYWDQFLAGDFQRRRLVVLSAETGKVVWSRDANYRHRPLVVGNRIIAEPWAFYLHTGEQDVRTHPLTGQRTAWKFIRPGHHCGAISATPSTLFFRSGYTAYYDLLEDSGTKHFGGHRLGCWINTIPANGLVMIPEASAGCACLFSLTSTVVFEPETERQEWSVYTAEGTTTPVQHMALNLGAPGDRRDARGRLWLSYPRPWSRPGLDLPLEITPMSMFGSQGRFFQHNDDSCAVVGSESPWVFTSGTLGMTHCNVPLIGSGQPSAEYTVRLYFAAPEGDQPGKRVFDIRLQGETVAENVDVVAQADGPLRALVIERTGIHVTRDLAIQLLPRATRPNDRQQPILCGIEVLRSGAEEIVVQVAGN